MGVRMRKKLVSSIIVAVFMAFSVSAANGNPRIKDIADFEGLRDNMLVGYGLVVGLNGTGDSLSSAVFTRESLIGMLDRLGVNARNSSLNTANVAAVMVTGTLKPFSTQGTRMDVNVSAIGDAKSLLGGTLLVTPLMGADGAVYAVAQGPVAVGGFSAEGNAVSIVKNIPTTGRIANGAIIEKEVDFNLAGLSQFRLALRNPDLTTARRVMQAVNDFIGQPVAALTDNATVMVTVPETYSKNTVGLMTDIEQLRIIPDQPAKVVIDDQSGMIVMGADVKVSRVAIAQGNLTIRITETPQVSQPSPFSQGGTTETVDRTTIDVDEQANNKLAILPEGVSLQELVNGLNALGIGPRDMISILQSIKAAGALQAEIEVI